MDEHGDIPPVEFMDLVRDDPRRVPRNLPKVLVIYAGGTIGSAPRDWEDPESPEVVYPWEELKASVRGLKDIAFPVDAVSFREPLDSANVGPQHWRKIAELIGEHYDEYAGFVLAHGTDTMVYTASALSFILRNLGKPVVITGSQIPALRNIRNDAEQNLLTSLMIANPAQSNIPCVPEVCIFFRDRLFRGNRCRKVDASGYAAFRSPNYPELGIAGERIDIREMFVRPPASGGFSIQPNLNTNVITVDIFPGFQNNRTLMRNLLGSPGLAGIVLKTYGAGNVPTIPGTLLDEIRRAADNGVSIVNVTQCLKGDVQQGLYDTSAALQDAGVISGQDITPEAALCKLMNILGDQDLPEAERRGRISRNLAGEQRWGMYTTVIDNEPQPIDSGNGADACYRSGAVEVTGGRAKGQVRRGLLRFVGAGITGADKLLLKIFVNLPATVTPDMDSPTFAGTFRKRSDASGAGQTFTFDIAPALRRVLMDRSTITVCAEPLGEGRGILSWKRLELTLFIQE